MRRRALILVAVAALAASADAQAKAVPVGGIRWEVDLPTTQSTWLARQLGNCTIFLETGWKQGFDKKKKLTYFLGGGLAKGSFDVDARRGAVADKGVALDFDALPKTGGRSWQLAQPGIELTGGKAYVTAVIKNVKSRLSAARRTRIAVIARPKLLSGAAHDLAHKGQTIPDSYLIAIQGNAKVLPALTAAFERSRCKSKRQAGFGNGPIRAGSRFGFVTAQLQPDAAIGLAGAAIVEDGPNVGNDEDAKVDAQPIAPATFVTERRVRNLKLPMTPGVHAALVCQRGFLCEPAEGASFALAGGFTFTYAGRTVTVTDIAAKYVKVSNGNVVPQLDATVDGTRMTIVLAGAPEGTEEYRAHLGQVLGLTVYAAGLPLTPSFTSTGSA